MTFAKHPATFGAWVRTRRRQLDLTQAELGKRAGCSEPAIRKIESDERRPSRQLAELLSQALEIPASEKEIFLEFARGMLPEEFQIEARTNPHNLPVLLTSTIDRTHDLAAVSGLLQDEAVHLVTLIGPPGIGKTRLSIHTGQNLLDRFRDGVWFVDLADVTNAGYFIPAVARSVLTLDLPPSPDLSQLLGGLRGRSLLLILDNFEQIVEGAALEVAQILKTCPLVKILVTSRLPLHLYGENEYPLLPLSIPPRGSRPTEGSLMQFESVQLFLARIRQHQPKFKITPENTAAVIEICTVLDGIPLALELAAATLRQMTLPEMVSVLRNQGWVKQMTGSARNLPQRQRTLENVIEWSYNLLGDRQKEVFCKLGVLSGWFDAGAATAVCESEALPFLNSLTEHSLLVRENVRGKTHWRMLELIHEYAVSRLTSETRSHVELVRARYLLGQIQVLNQHAEREVRDNYFLTNFSNFQNAVSWAIDEGHTALSVRLISELNDCWETLGYFKEGFDLARRFLRSATDLDPRTRAYLLQTASTLAWHQHDFDTALTYAKDAFQWEHEYGGENEDPMYRNLLGRIYIEQGNFSEARVVLEECLALVFEKPGHLNPGSPLAQLGEVALFEGRLGEARSLLEKALTYLDKEDAIFLAMAKTDLAEGDNSQAFHWLQQAYPLASQHIRRFLVFLCTLAGYLLLIDAGQENKRKAARLYGAIETLGARSGVHFNLFYQNLNRGRMELAHGELPMQEWIQANAEGQSWSREQTQAKAEAELR